VTHHHPPVDGQLASNAPAELGTRLGRWSVGRAPAYRELADAVGVAIATGALQGRLPSERELAAAASVSRTTAVATYTLLAERGLVERRRGSGTFVAGARRRATHTCEDPIACVRAFFAEA